MQHLLNHQVSPEAHSSSPRFFPMQEIDVFDGMTKIQMNLRVLYVSEAPARMEIFQTQDGTIQSVSDCEKVESKAIMKGNY